MQTRPAQRKLILHVGLPKTGTSALQRWCDINREVLSSIGVDYPDKYLDPFVPKHQFLVQEIMQCGFPKLKEIVALVREETVVLSTEGLTNHFIDFPSDGMATFREILRDFEITVFVVTRERDAWTKSYYKQCVINPPSQVYPYATALPLAEFSLLPRIRFLAEVDMQLDRLAQSFGARKLVHLDYQAPWFRSFAALIGAQSVAAKSDVQQVNVSVADDIVDLIRQINAQNLAYALRSRLLDRINLASPSKHNILSKFYSVSAPATVSELRLLQAVVAVLTPSSANAEVVLAAVQRSLQQELNGMP